MEPVLGTYFFSALLPPVAAVRMLQRARRTDTNGTGHARSDLHLSPVALDRLLAMPGRAEAGLIRRGASLPAGVSVGMVCMRR